MSRDFLLFFAPRLHLFVDLMVDKSLYQDALEPTLYHLVSLNDGFFDNDFGKNQL